jgi:hypothetical protein
VNSVRLYSNGTAIISRNYTFKGREPLRVSIPVRKSDLDDVISSLAVFGDVTIAEPPTYTPTNADPPELSLDPAAALTDLATKLAGASVEIEAGTTYKGRLVGLQRTRREANGTFAEQCRLVVLTDNGVQQIDEAAVTALRFTDPFVRSEIDKALRESLGTIKPDSSTVELTIEPNPGTTSALVAYATPVAAWKIRYQLRLSPEGAELEGQAVVDNDTDDDWADTLITVISGEPITFSTDLAEVRRPARSRVNVVADRATGAVSAETPMSRLSERGFSRDALSAASEDFAMDEDAGLSMTPPPHAMTRAEQPQAEVRESGDFSAFTSPRPLSIGANRSAIIPLFRAAVSEAQALLYYKEQDDRRRPFRAVRLMNPAAHSLGRGICEVFVGGDFRGKCVLEPTRPGDEMTLVHAKETGVRVVKEASRPGSRRMAIRISEGVVYCEDLNRRETVYRVQNGHVEDFPLEIEHPRTWDDSTLEVSASSGSHEVVDIPGGRRVRATLPARGSLAVTVIEEQIAEQRFSLSVSWLHGNVIELHAPASQIKGIRKCIDLQGEIDNVRSWIVENEEKAATIAEEQERLMKLIPNAHGEQAHAWRTDLASAERELREIKRSALPKLKDQLRNAQGALHEALRNLRYEWSERGRDAFR